jgi:predicted amidohydrolase
MLVFPEFSLDLPLRKKLVTWLRRNAWDDLIYLVPGSFHEQLACGDFYNTAPLLCASSQVLFTHQKLKLFGNIEVGAERAEIGDVLHAVVTPLGLLTVVICKDFMDADPAMASLLQEVPINWVLVPSFGDDKTLRAHKTRAHALATFTPGANSAVANAVNTAGKKEGLVLAPIPGFGHRCNQREAVDIDLNGSLITFPFQLKIKPQP